MKIIVLISFIFLYFSISESATHSSPEFERVLGDINSWRREDGMSPCICIHPTSEAFERLQKMDSPMLRAVIHFTEYRDDFSEGQLPGGEASST